MTISRSNISVMLLLALYALVYTPAAELFKIPVLVTHFREHKAADRNLSVIRFLMVHYFNDDPQNADYAGDMQLPFKNGECTVTCFAAVFLPTRDKQLPDVPVCTVDVQPVMKDVAFLSSVFTAAIWQPPRQG